MKLIIFCVAIFATTSCVLSQTDEINLKKYWKFRSEFLEQNLKIGALEGESLPAGSRKPLVCIDNGDADNDPLTYGLGEMHWGDGTIRHGHYLTLLATEYALRKKSNLDTTGILNELYYALNAINRLDKKAESELDFLYGIEGFYGESLNGFYLREDIPQDFNLYWQEEKMKMYCTNSTNFQNNNTLNLNNNSNLLFYPNTSHQNTPSLDQATSLMVGFLMVKKLVPNTYVKPTSNDQGFYIITELQNIVHRMMQFYRDRDWQMIDVNGWPVANGGGDLSLVLVPFLHAAYEITGIDYSTGTPIRRRQQTFSRIQHCYTGYGPEGGPELQQTKCNEISGVNILEDQAEFYLQNAVPAGIGNNQNISNYMAWQAGGTVFLGEHLLDDAWGDLIPNHYSQILNDIQDDGQISFLPPPFDELHIGDDIQVSDYNNVIIFNAGIMSGLWNKWQVHNMANFTEHRQLQLIHAVLNDEDPAASKLFFQTYLNNLGPEGPYSFKSYIAGPNSENYFYSQSNGWHNDYRWTHPNASNQDEPFGIFSALDYMVLHNLYYLIYDDELPEYSETYDCFCSNPPQISNSYFGNNTYEVSAAQDINARLAYLPSCPVSVFEPVNNMVFGIFDVEPKFSDYETLEISVVKYQVEDAIIQNGGKVNVISDLILCNQTELVVANGGELHSVKGDVQMGEFTHIDVMGDLRIGTGTKISLGKNAPTKISLRSGANLIIEDGAQLLLDYAGVLEFYDGAHIIMEGENSEILLKGNIKLMNGGIFEIEHPNGPSGRLIIDGGVGSVTGSFSANNVPNAAPAVVKLHDNSINDEFLIIKENKEFYTYPVNNIDFEISSCKIVFENNAKLHFAKDLNTWDCFYYSENNNQGLIVQDYNKFNGCQFENVPVYGDFSYPSPPKLQLIGCDLAAISGINTQHEALVTVFDGGYFINNCTFHGNNDFCLKSEDRLYPSTVANSTFDNHSSITLSSLSGIIDVSNSELKVISSSFNDLYVGVYKADGELTLRCNDFDNSLFSHVAAVFGCHVNGSVDDYAGYNSFGDAGAQSIYLLSSTININNGYNFFAKETPSFIIGTTNYSCAPNTSCSIYATKNQWGNNLATPSSAKFNIASSNGSPLTVFANQTASKPGCGSMDNNGNPSNNPNGIAQNGGNNNGMANSNLPFIAMFNNPNVRLDNAIKYGRSNMRFYDSVKVDSVAINVFDEIFENNISKNNRHVVNWLNQSINDMKTSLENAAYENTISMHNTGVFDFYVQKYVDVLNKMSDSLIDYKNYVEQFYLELDKAQLYRLLGQPIKGLEIMEHVENCGLNAPEQQVLNYWKKRYKLEVEMNAQNLSYLDYYEVDTSSFYSPIVYTPSIYGFGSKLISPTLIDYKDCNNNRTAGNFIDNYEADGVELYPNPAKDQVTVASKNFNLEIESIEILASDGRAIFRCDVGALEKDIDVNNWAPGYYLCKIHLDNGTLKLIRFTKK